ncbi:cGMP-dependent 3',5'-cyclic phosphodiesterase-like isoform X2 [Ceratina calcarata]|uniref:Phosphodiesterase n=1 Tax=Ceratina calcarata TaxID=156304 RepID=A0AAJ7NFP2_9HYME|nr:cGMP-dependent 3',5'-cyclic phosphodiesterase-like isoform X1 [Ceratina calcarata]XP_017893027.1 cGMP-dependent 3',5'-cyclic phosphodiesterase-like isoform X2 [Ceratina calcarata]
MSSVNLDASNTERILLLLEELCDLSYPEVQQKLNKYIQTVTNSELSFLAPILTKSEEMVIHVIGEKILDRELRFPVSNNVLYKPVQTKKPTATDIAKLDEELLRHLEPMCSITNTFLTIPIQHPKHNYVVLLVSLFDNDPNKEGTCKCAIVQECFRFCLGFLLNSFIGYEETRLKLQCQNLLAISRKLFSHLGEFSDLLREIMAEVRNLTNAERCSLFLLDPEHEELVAKVFDGLAIKDSHEMRIPIGQGIAGHVATTGKLLNIRDAYKDPLFYKGVDELTGFKTRNILCFPIRDENGVIGVAQLCNKKDGLYFDVYDEEVAMAFSIYCGLSIMHSIVYKKMQIAQARNKLSREIMMYHMKVEDDSIQLILHCLDEHNIKDFDQFHFSPRSIPYNHMPCYTIRMFNELGLTTYFKLKLPTLTRFILYVKKGYRDAPYHNWTHAFATAHFGYLLIKNLDLINQNYMTHLEAMVFLVSCLTHDIDHRGTNNTFQTQSHTILASLYSSEGSVMERHHLAQTMCILNTDGCNVFEDCSSEEYGDVLDLLKDNILATDLAAHFREVSKQDEVIKMFDKTNPEHKRLLFNMLMTCCDLSDQTKRWNVTKKTAEQIYDEFFTQGDLEKSMGSLPIEMMDRERASIPHLQVQFLSNLVIPLFINISTLFPATQPLVSVLEENRYIWEHCKHIFNRYIETGMKAMEVLLDPNFEDEVFNLYTTSKQTLTTVQL